MSTRDDLREMQRALDTLMTGGDITLSLCFGFQRDPASGRGDWLSVPLPVSDRKDVCGAVMAEVTRLRKELAAELREEATRLVGSE